MRKIWIYIFINMICIDGFADDYQHITCFHHQQCELAGAGATCGANGKGTCIKDRNGCWTCQYVQAITPGTVCVGLPCTLEDSEKQWESESETSHLYRRPTECSYKIESGKCVKQYTYEYACASGYRVRQRSMLVSCINCPPIVSGPSPQSGTIDYNGIKLNTSTSVTSCYLPASNNEYSDNTGYFVVATGGCYADE